MTKNSNKSLSIINPTKLDKTALRVMQIWLDTQETDHLKIMDIYNESYRNEDERKVAPRHIHNAIRKIKRLFLQENANELKDLILDEYFVLYNEALTSWLNSKEDEIIVTETREETHKGFKESVQERRKPQTGDPRHLSNAAKILQSLRELSGIDAPKKFEHILKEEMTLVMEYLAAALKPEVYDSVLLALQNYNSTNNLIIDVESEEL